MRSIALFMSSTNFCVNIGAPGLYIDVIKQQQAELAPAMIRLEYFQSETFRDIPGHPEKISANQRPIRVICVTNPFILHPSSFTLAPT